MAGQRWTRDELLITFNLYWKLPFGRLHHSNPSVMDLAGQIGRTPNSVAMKLVNLAALDPSVTGRGRRGLRNVSRQDREIFDEFSSNQEQLACASEEAWERLVGGGVTQPTLDESGGSTEVQRTIRARRVQRFFRDALIANYGGCCAISNIDIPSLLNASHIIPWSDNIPRRADPTNGVLLCAIYDRAYDRGLMTFDDQYRVVLADRLRDTAAPAMLQRMFGELEGHPLRIPDRAPPDPDALRYHREHVFARNN